MNREERDQAILQLYGEGVLIKDIAVLVGMAANSVGMVLRRLGVERPAKPQKRWFGKEDPTQRIIALWKEGLCASQIAERIGESRGVVGGVLMRSGIRKGQIRHRYDGIGGIGRHGRGDRGAFARIARRT